MRVDKKLFYIVFATRHFQAENKLEINNPEKDNKINKLHELKKNIGNIEMQTACTATSDSYQASLGYFRIFFLSNLNLNKD